MSARAKDEVDGVLSTYQARSHAQEYPNSSNILLIASDVCSFRIRASREKLFAVEGSYKYQAAVLPVLSSIKGSAPASRSLLMIALLRSDVNPRTA